MRLKAEKKTLICQLICIVILKNTIYLKNNVSFGVELKRCFDIQMNMFIE